MRVSSWMIGLLAVLLIGSWAVGAEGVRLDKMTDWTVIVAADAIPSERYAAEEFQSLFKRAVGITLPIVSSPAGAAKNVFIGQSKAMAAANVGFGVGDLGEEGLRIHIQPDNIAIAGGRPRGTLYGVYEFFERYLGVRFLTHDHTYVPPRADRLDIPCERYTYRPPFSFRWAYFGPTNNYPVFAARLRNNTVTKSPKLGGVTSQRLIGHTLRYLLPGKKYFKDHPEYFAMVNGVRLYRPKGRPPQPCVTNPDAIRIVAEAVIRRLDKNPHWTNISVSQNDTDEYCRCPKCSAINLREGTPTGSHLAFINAVAELVEKKYPNVQIGTLVYNYTRQAPRTVVPRHNVQIQLCTIECCTLHALDDPNCRSNREFVRDIEKWKQICDDIWVWNYNIDFKFKDLPLPSIRSVGANVRFLLANGVKGLFMQGTGRARAGDMSDLRNYVISRCIWNPQLDSWAVAEEFCRLHYGQAAQPIIDYLKLIHDNAEAAGVHPSCYPSARQIGLRPAVARKSFEYFEKAMALAKDETVRLRVEKASIGAYKSMIEAGGELDCVDGVYKMRLPAKYDGILDRYIDICKRNNITSAGEGNSAKSYFQKARQALEGFPAVVMENDVWRLIFLSAYNGSLVEMIYKPTGRNLFSPQKELFGVGGSHEEHGFRGYHHGRPLGFTVKQEKDSLILTKNATDGSMTMVRRISFDDKFPNKVFFQTTITHKAPETKTYRVKVRPEFTTGIVTTDTRLLSGYVKDDDGRWMKFNEGWFTKTGPKKHLLRTGKTQGIGWFNHEAGFGLLETYKSGGIDYPRIWWRAEAQANFELITRLVDLKQGQSVSYAYQFEYVTKPPL